MGKKSLWIIIFFFLPSYVSGFDYIIGEGDSVAVSVWGEKELSQTVKVRPDGKITIPVVGEIEAAGLSPQNLQTLVAQKMKVIVKNPVVTISVAEVTNNKVYVFGGGVTPGVYNLNQRMSLLQLLCQIGQQNIQIGQQNISTVIGQQNASALNDRNMDGTRNADLKKSYILRKGKKIKEDFYGLFSLGNVSEDIIIEPNDVIFIPRQQKKNIYIMGAVNFPKFIEFREGMTVMEAILEAGGFTKFAKQNDVVIYREEGDKEKQIHVKAKDLINDGDLKQNIKLLLGDYIVVKEGIF